MPTLPNETPSFKDTLSKFSPWKNNDNPTYPLNRYILRRNIAGFPFAEKISAKDAENLSSKLSATFKNLFPNGLYYSSKDLKENEMQLLFEHLFLANREPMHPEGGIFIDLENSIIALFHLEDHITLFFHDNEHLNKDIDSKILNIDEQIQSQIPFAFSDQFGYITASAIHLGTALTKEAIIHAPAINLMKQNLEIDDKIIIHGLASEKQVLHNLIIATNKYSLGVSEKSISEKVDEVGSQISHLEKEIINNLSDKDKQDFFNLISKNFGQALYCKSLNFHEGLDLASYLDLGISMGAIESSSKTLFFDLFFSLRRAHLNSYFSNDKSSIEEKRALLLKEKVKDLKLCI
ncbi:MAG: Protein-arginine kinase [Chlamydiia bacterium]|nr:Protein-arginine kinase [Chlamydiia bacterium]